VDLTVVVAFAVAVFVLSVVPGPDMMFVVANAVAGGRRAGLVAAVGMSTGLAVHTFAGAFGLGALIQTAPAVLDGVRIVGAVFLVYLAVSTWRASRQHPTTPVTPTTPTTTEDALQRLSFRKVYVMATLTNLANPKVVLFYLAFLPQFLTTGPTGWPVMGQLLTLGAVFIAVGLAVDATAGVLAGSLSGMLLRRGSARRALDRVAAAIFGGLAARLVLDIR
jgi:threonine/homoserine/homoserine lactone efflux protein